MRKDMAKVIVERPRRGGNYERKRRELTDHEDLPKKQGMKRPYMDPKSLNENLAPLKRFLNKSVNRPWNKVFSEICANLKVTSTVQKHVRDHVRDFVALQVEQDGKKVMTRRRWGTFYELQDRELYVHPKTGILSVYRRPKTVRRAAQDPMIAQLNQLLSGAKGDTVLDNEVYYKVYQNPKTGAVAVHLANATHARQDAKVLLSDSLFYPRVRAAEKFFRTHGPRFQKIRSPYTVTLWDLFWEGLAQYERKVEVERERRLEKEKNDR